MKKHEPIPEPPTGLSEKSQELWRANIDRARCIGRQVLLTEALRARDRADECRLAVNEAGLLVTTQRSGVAHLNPLLAAEERFRRQFTTAWLALGLQIQPRPYST
jgi:phage terminase small subunit